MRFRLPTHRPGYRLRSTPDAVRVERRGPAGHLPFRLFVSAVLLLFAAMPPAAVYAFSDGSWLAPLVAIPLFTLFPWYPFLALIAWGVGLAVGSYRWIEVDGPSRRIRALRDAHFLWATRTREVGADDLRGLAVELADSDLPGRVEWASLVLTTEGGRWPWAGEERTTGLRFHAEALVDRERLVAFAHGVARLLGWRGWEIERNDHLGTRILLHPTAEGEDVAVVPERSAGAGRLVAAPEGAIHVEPPEIDLPPFDPDSLASAWSVRVWEPGERVELRKPGLTRSELVRASVLGTLLLNLPTIAAGAAFLTGAAGDVGLFWKLVVAAVFLCVTFLYNAFLLTEGRTSRRTVFDWGEGVCRLLADRRTVTVPMDRVEGIEVTGVRHGDRSGDDDVRFSCELWLLTDRGKGRIAETRGSPVEEGPYAAAASMAEDLAEALGVPWTWRGWEERTLLDEARSLWERLVRRYGG